MRSVKEIIADAQKIANDTGANDGYNRGRSMAACGFVGGIAGLMIGYSAKWNLLYSAIGGVLIGVVAGRIFTPKS